MTAMTTPRITAAEQLLEQLLTGDSWERMRAHGDLLRDSLGGLTVVDEACRDNHGRPLVLPLAIMWKHLCRVDAVTVVAARGGVRVHTTTNTYLGSAEDDAHGPALGRGGDPS